MMILALRMLTGDRAKFLSITIGLSFSVMLIVQQGSIFTGLVRRSGAIILDTKNIDLWVFDARVKNVDDLRTLKSTDLFRVRSVPGVEWATRYFKSQARARRLNGQFENVLIIGVDDDTQVGGPEKMISGETTDLLRRDAGIIDIAGAQKMGGVTVGEELTFNDRRAVIVGTCEVTRNFQSLPVVFTRYSQAINWATTERNTMSAILVKIKPGYDVAKVQESIRRETGLAADTPDEFRWRTIMYVLKYTGIAINFGVTVLLGFIVGAAIAGQTFYTFAIDNLKNFGALKAMGASNFLLARMLSLQAMTVAALAYGIGVGVASIFARLAGPNGQLPFFPTPQLLGGAAVAVFLIAIAAGLVALRKVRAVEPAAVFR